jgi:hypothetical protein
MMPAGSASNVALCVATLSLAQVAMEKLGHGLENYVAQLKSLPHFATFPFIIEDPTDLSLCRAFDKLDQAYSDSLMHRKPDDLDFARIISEIIKHSPSLQVEDAIDQWQARQHLRGMDVRKLKGKARYRIKQMSDTLALCLEARCILQEVLECHPSRPYSD